MKKLCCGRTAKTQPNPRDFCAALTMATGVTVEAQGPALVITVMTPGGARMRLDEALSTFKCQETVAPGVRLAKLCLSALQRAVGAGRTNVIPVGRQMPLLMLKEKLFRLVERCTTCQGSSCAACNHTGFR